MDTVVIALGGSVLAPADPDPYALLQWTEAVKVWSQEAQLCLVVGGGHPARQWIEFARESSVDEEDLDRIGIQATRLNAQVFATFLRGNGVDVNPEIPCDTAKAAALVAEHGVVVMGGTNPGHSTDEVAASLARETGAARLVIVSNVDGVYTADPGTDPDAERIDTISFEDLLELVGGPEWVQAGAKGIVDGPAAALLCKTGTDTCVVGGRNITNVGQALRGLEFEGTRITRGA